RVCLAKGGGRGVPYIDHHQAPGTTCLTTFIRSGPAIGLTSQPVAPSFLPSFRFSALLSVVRVRIGVNLNPGMALRFLISSSPPILGMLMSVMIRSGLGAVLSLARASSPSLAVLTA